MKLSTMHIVHITKKTIDVYLNKGTFIYVKSVLGHN